MLQGIIDGDVEKAIEQAQSMQLKSIRQQEVHWFIPGGSRKSILVDMDDSFEEACFVLESYNVQKPKELSIYEFKRKLEIIKKKNANGNKKQKGRTAIR